MFCGPPIFLISEKLTMVNECWWLHNKVINITTVELFQSHDQSIFKLQTVNYSATCSLKSEKGISKYYDSTVEFITHKKLLSNPTSYIIINFKGNGKRTYI